MSNIEFNTVKQALDRQDISILEDGYYYYFPSRMGGLNSQELRAIADFLDRKNSAWDWIISNDPAIGVGE